MVVKVANHDMELAWDEMDKSRHHPFLNQEQFEHEMIKT